MTAEPKNTAPSLSVDERVDLLQQSIEKEQEEYKTVVLEALKTVCTPESSFEDLRAISKAIEKDKNALVAQAVAGGKTNISYKVTLQSGFESKGRSNAPALFCKVCFSFARWNPDRSVPYDLKRTENEFWIMGEFAKMMNAAEHEATPPIATPYHILDLTKESKLIVTKWAKCDEQWCNQFIEGHVDKRVIPKLARALSTLNLSDVMEQDFNSEIRGAGENMFQLMKDIFQQVHEGGSKDGKGNDEIDDKCVRATKAMSVKTFNEICDKSHEMWHTYETPSHTDAHVFNILVEKKPNVEQLESSFGSKGDVVLCDWEMSACCSKGTDVGKVLFFPLVCALCHAVQGHEQEAFHILQCMDQFWAEYSKCMANGGKDDEYLRETFRDAIGWCGLFIFFVFYHLKMFQDVAPLHDGATSEDEAKMALASCGFVGLKLMEYGFGTSLKSETSLADLMHLYKMLLRDEVDYLLAVRPSYSRPRQRRSSLLRHAGRRVSDSFLYDQETVELAKKRHSSTVGKRRSSMIDPLLVLALEEADDE